MGTSVCSLVGLLSFSQIFFFIFELIKPTVGLIPVLKCIFHLTSLSVPHFSAVYMLQALSRLGLASPFAPVSFLYVWLQHIQNFIAWDIGAGEILLRIEI